jgi:acetylornithine deacetylase/succinyl-diaminopimelate desuccinylase-like protein
MTLRHERLALLDRYIRIPTISRTVTPAMVEQVRAFWRDIGLDLTPLPHPQGLGTTPLYAELPGPADAPTVLLYGHYDVQPTGDPALWQWEGVKCEPFEPRYFLDGREVDPGRLDGAELDRVLVVARGAADNKGQHLSNILGALDAARAGTLRWNVKIILDGEEEHGSPNLRAVVEAHKDRLACDVMICSDGPKPRNQPALTMGVRGLYGIDLYAENDQRVSVHSGNYGNIVENPVLPLAALVADLRERVRTYAEQHDDFRREATDLFAEWADRATWKPFLWPTANINHLMTDGASPTLRRTIIPRQAHARVDIRLTPDTPPDAIRQIIDATIADHQQRAPAGITFRTSSQSITPATYTSPARPEFDWLMSLLAELGDGDPVALPTLGGTLPTYMFPEVLNAPLFLLPAANADNQQHDINEHYIFKHYFLQTRLYARIVSTRPGETRPRA